MMSEDIYDAVEEGAMFWVDVWNPVGTFELAMDPTVEGVEDYLVHKAAQTAVIGGAVFIGHAVSGGGASMSMYFGSSLPSMFEGGTMYYLQAGVKKEVKRATMGFLSRAGLSLARLTPGALALAALAGVTYYGNQLYADWSGSLGIGDMSGWHTGYSQRRY